MSDNVTIRKLASTDPIYKLGFRWAFTMDGAMHYAKTRGAARDMQKRIRHNIDTFLIVGPTGRVRRKTKSELRKGKVAKQYMPDFAQWTGPRSSMRDISSNH